MAYFAELDQNNIVVRVVSVGDWVTTDENGIEHETWGEAFCRKLFGQDTVWKQTSFNTIAGQHTNGKIPFRKNYAGIGFTYDAQRDAFIPPAPEGDGWILDEEKCIWRNPQLEKEEAELELAKQQIEIGVSRV